MPINEFLHKLSDLKELISKSERYIPFLGEPIYQIKEYLNYQFKYKKTLEFNKCYKDLHKGKRCFIIGNGPSLSKCDLSLLKNEYCISVNSMTATKEFEIIKPKYHVIVDYLRFDKNISSLCENMKNLRFLKHKPTFVFPVKFKQYVQKNGYDKNIDIIYTQPLPNFKKNIRDIDFTKRIPAFTNVANVALYLAIYLGFKDIYLLGVDMTGIVKTFKEDEGFDTGSHFYDSKMRDVEINDIKEIQAERSNEIFLSSYAQTFKILRFTNYFAKRKGISILNATKGGTLDVFPRIKYESLFK